MAWKKSDYSTDEGEVSEWNEGNLKSLRLHEAQQLINVSKINPLKQIENNSWNYSRWIDGITILYGEGQAKYSTEETELIEKLKEIILLKLKLLPIIKNKNTNGVFDNHNKIIINYENWESLRKLIELYEQKVKKSNDDHGLSTRNKNDDWEGL